MNTTPRITLAMFIMVFVGVVRGLRGSMRSLVLWFSLRFSNQGNSLVFRVFSAIFLCFSRGFFLGSTGVKNPWCFGLFSLVFTWRREQGSLRKGSPDCYYKLGCSRLPSALSRVLFCYSLHREHPREHSQELSGLPNANAKSQRFSYAISQITPLPPVVALNRSFISQIEARYAAFWHAVPQIALTSFLWCPKSQRFKSQRFLTFFHADFGKEFPSRNSCRGRSWNCPFPSSVLCPLLYRTEQFLRGEKGEKGVEKGGGRGVTSKGGKKEKRTRENRSGYSLHREHPREHSQEHSKSTTDSESTLESSQT